MRDQILAIDTDVWVFTETHRDVDPGPGYRIVACSSPALDRSGAERWVSIWARTDLTNASYTSANTERTACARISFETGADWYVYGVVLPWHGDKRRSPVMGKEGFMEALDEQASESVRIQATHPKARLLVAGDFNQDLLDDGHFYGSRARRRVLQDALERAELECVTGGSTDPVARQNEGQASIDHVCIPRDRGVTVTSMAVWPSTAQLRCGLSDHHGVVVSLNVA